jgi:hypothetical protein
MKLSIALVAAGLVSSLTAIAPTPAHAQRDPACVERCLGRDTSERTGACIAACPAAYEWRISTRFRNVIRYRRRCG